MRKGVLTGSTAERAFSNPVNYTYIRNREISEDDLIENRRAKKQIEYAKKFIAQDEWSMDAFESENVIRELIKKGWIRKHADYSNVELNSSIDDVIMKLIAEKFFAKEDTGVGIIPNFAMQRGNLLEPVARKVYEKITNRPVEEIGFIMNKDFHGMIGCSPDGLINNREGGVEFKCPLPHTHMRYVKKNVLPSTYKWQVHLNMISSETKYWDFMSFVPPCKIDGDTCCLKPFLFSARWNKFTFNLQRACLEFCDRYAEAILEFKAGMMNKELTEYVNDLVTEQYAVGDLGEPEFENIEFYSETFDAEDIASQLIGKLN